MACGLFDPRQRCVTMVVVCVECPLFLLLVPWPLFFGAAPPVSLRAFLPPDPLSQ